MTSEPAGATTRGGALAPEHIRDAALHLFAGKGYRATTMEDIGSALGVRGPSLYRLVRSKQQLLVEIISATMNTLLAEQRQVMAAGGSPATRIRRMVEAHVRFHAANREQAFVGNREIDSLESDDRRKILRLRSRYERTLRTVIEEGRTIDEFRVENPRLASFAILDMGIGVATWFRDAGPNDVSQVAYTYAEYAVALLTAG